MSKQYETIRTALTKDLQLYLYYLTVAESLNIQDTALILNLPIDEIRRALEAKELRCYMGKISQEERRQWFAKKAWSYDLDKKVRSEIRKNKRTQ